MVGIQSRSVEEVFSDVRGRRAGLLKALSTDVRKFYHECDPGELFHHPSCLTSLCLYGLPNETWEVDLPVDEVPPELPEPALGINFARDGMPEKDWISLVAVHSDSWLISVAFYFGARFGFGKNERKKLFNMRNDLPIIFEVITIGTLSTITGNVKQSKDQSANHNSNRSKPRQSESHTKASKMSPPPREDDDSGDDEEDDEQGAVCGACGDNHDDFWICCDACEKWFHGKCVKITPAKAEHIKHYKFPTCNTNKKIKA
ncbi:hypothetical protein Bca4012_025548 [Brassica carinata]|uniref:PHD finger protein ALFIN-LIKE n=1 Tax=Brassica carinata TaxID=52824 RepID=A0A8X8ATF2_BRACI|nr:hypothetical protein Bca52824_022649 [Brassica carinata]